MATKLRVKRPAATVGVSLPNAIKHAKALLVAAGDAKAASAILTALR